MTVSKLTKDLQHTMGLNGFAVDENLDIGISAAVFHASMKKRWLLLPWSLQYYVLESDMEPVPDLKYARDLFQAALDHTSTSFRSARWIRWTIPITVLVIISSNGFTEELKLRVRNKKHFQVGHVGCVFLVDTQNTTVHRLQKVGISGSVPLILANRFTLGLLEQAGCFS